MNFNKPLFLQLFTTFAGTEIILTQYSQICFWYLAINCYVSPKSSLVRAAGLKMVRPCTIEASIALLSQSPRHT